MSVQPIAANLSAVQARELTDRIRQTLRVGHDLIIQAFSGRAWVALGYETWDAYCAGEFADARMVRLDREQRREIVAEMRQAGMSLPAISSATGIPRSTVHSDLPVLTARGVDLPDKVTRTDGRSNAATWSATAPSRVNTETGEITEPAPVATKPASRRPLGEFAKDAGWELRQAAERIERILADDRYSQNADQVATALRSHLIYTADSVANALSRIR